ncbi:hypothetical protein J2W42_006019 [Rhizobium tibeticum]|uniref:Uncharacterized protein n=1 Tax=Rhizobium tibeticum TaxID=501024 RepID=A0A1H8VWT1_9HYPH|nr:hypothetical protein [Rhizobium tibeticum]MDP9813148.1 hypothetical protein [Rhizobium tibeticum]SEH97673.1 hypothetical protein RTCCBAU85039_3439 [Rhizobium tibeticum]SEP19846.1 hypothetical protein SAMN05216228_104832 [Rhizobium tibeticum]
MSSITTRRHIENIIGGVRRFHYGNFAVETSLLLGLAFAAAILLYGVVWH